MGCLLYFFARWKRNLTFSGGIPGWIEWSDANIASPWGRYFKP